MDKGYAAAFKSALRGACPICATVSPGQLELLELPELLELAAGTMLQHPGTAPSRGAVSGLG
jgi:hypothetical protein